MTLTETMQHIGASIREARKQLQLSQTEISHEVGCAHENICRLEKGLPAIQNLFTICRILQVVGLELRVVKRENTK